VDITNDDLEKAVTEFMAMLRRLYPNLPQPKI
jgi:hypothetical protein